MAQNTKNETKKNEPTDKNVSTKKTTTKKKEGEPNQEALEIAFVDVLRKLNVPGEIILCATEGVSGKMDYLNGMYAGSTVFRDEMTKEIMSMLKEEDESLTIDSPQVSFTLGLIAGTVSKIEQNIKNTIASVIENI